MVCSRRIGHQWCVQGASDTNGVFQAPRRSMVCSMCLGHQWCVEGASDTNGVLKVPRTPMVCGRCLGHQPSELQVVIFTQLYLVSNFIFSSRLDNGPDLVDLTGPGKALV